MRSITVALLILAAIAGCGSGDKPVELGHPSELLPAEVGSTGISRVGEVRTYVGQDLWEYIDGGAELYHTYNFVEVATADYKKNDVELVADIYQFDTPLNAYGLYSMLRPENPDFINRGAEGFIATSQIMYVDNRFLVKLVSYQDNDESDLAMVNLADDLARVIDEAFGESKKPAGFDLFPAAQRVPGTDQYWSEEFAGHSFMTAVYSVDYQIDSTRITLFMTDDEPGKKVLEWSAAVEKADKLDQVPSGLSFDDGKGFATVDAFYGTIAIGLKNGHLAGVIGYNESVQPFVAGWFNALGPAGSN